MIHDFTPVDVLVVLVIVVSTLYAAVRGFVSETLSIIAWAAAAFATLYFAPNIAPYLRDRMSTPLVGTLVAYGGTFLAVLIPLSFMTYRFSQIVKNSPVSSIDRILGVVFGAARGLAVVGIAYILFCMFVPLRSQPHWIKDAHLYPLIKGSSEVLLTFVPDQNTGTADVSRQLDETSDSGPIARLAHGSAAARRAHKTYGADERRALDNLIETTGSGDGKP